MAEFIFTYRTPVDFTPGTPDGIAAWTACVQAWGLSSGTWASRGPNSATVVGSVDLGAALGGRTPATAQNLDEALTLAKGCPILAAGGWVEVGELADLPSRHGQH